MSAFFLYPCLESTLHNLLLNNSNLGLKMHPNRSHSIVWWLTNGSRGSFGSTDSLLKPLPLTLLTYPWIAWWFTNISMRQSPLSSLIHPSKMVMFHFFSMTRGAFPKSSELNQNTGGRAMRRPFRASWTALKARPSSRGLGWGLVGFQGLEALDFREVLGDLMSSRNFYGQALVSPGNK